MATLNTSWDNAKLVEVRGAQFIVATPIRFRMERAE